ncbi:MAG: hypothetical protein C0482_22045 [Gordonia sp.]|nr:hypothetical protein [Gordonia sp. (in: high G+C Gram-positive bacteria)]
MAGVVVVAALVVAMVVIAGGWAVSTVIGGTDDAPNADLPALDQIQSPTVAVPPPSVTDPACPTTAVGAVSWGKDAGGTDTGVEAIKKFDYGYYVLRSGEKAREAVAPDAVLMTDAATMQQAIAALPAETTHCLQITDRGSGTYEVRLAEFLPGAPPRLSFQVIETGVREGRTVITAMPTNVSIEQ